MKTFNELKNQLCASSTAKTVAVVWPADEDTLQSMALTLEQGVARMMAVGCRQQVEQHPALHDYAHCITIIDADSPDDAARQAVMMARDGRADAIMKGMINTDNLLRAVLDKQTGILTPGSVLTHVSVAQIAGCDRLLLFSDPAVIPHPTHEQRVEQVKYVATLCRKLGVDTPRIAMIHCSEKVNEKHFPHTVSYRTIAQMAADGEFGPCIADGPLDVKTALDLHSMQVKCIHSPINGQADALIFPDIEAGNVFYKTITLFAGAQTAGMLQGARVPVVVPSRGDSATSKFNSIMLAVL